MLENILRFQVFGSNTFRHILNMIYNEGEEREGKGRGAGGVS